MTKMISDWYRLFSSSKTYLSKSKRVKSISRNLYISLGLKVKSAKDSYIKSTGTDAFASLDAMIIGSTAQDDRRTSFKSEKSDGENNEVGLGIHTKD